MRRTREHGGTLIVVGVCAMVFASFYVSFTTVLVAIVLAIPLLALAEWMAPDPLPPAVIDLSHWEPDPEPEPAPYDVRSRITPKRLWSDG